VCLWLPFVFLAVSIGFDGKEWTFKEVDAIVNQVANWALAAGFRRGDNIALVMENCPEFIFLFFGLAKIGIGKWAPPVHTYTST